MLSQNGAKAGKQMRRLEALKVALAITAAGAGLLCAPTNAGSWYKAESDHFTVYSDTSEQVTRDYATKLEYFKALTDNLLDDGDANTDYEAPLPVYILNNSQDLKLVRPT